MPNRRAKRLYDNMPDIVVKEDPENEDARA